MQTATLIGIAALAFVGAAVFVQWEGEHPSCPATLEVIRYLPLPEPQPIYPTPALPDVRDFTSADSEPLPAQVKTASQTVDEDPAPRSRHHRHHYRRHARRR